MCVGWCPGSGVWDLGSGLWGRGSGGASFGWRYVRQHISIPCWGAPRAHRPASLKEAWLEVMFLRSMVVKGIRGGVGAIVGALVDKFFDSDSGQHMAKAGVWLNLADGSSLHLFADMGMVLADEAALHFVYNCKGAAGLKPCLLCQNVFSTKGPRNIVANDASGWAQPVTSCSTGKFVAHTSGTMKALRRRLAAAATTQSKTQFEELQTQLGWNWDPASVLGNRRWLTALDPPSRCCFDWMHVFFVGGVFCVHMGLLMWRLKPHKITYATLHAYLQPWRWPLAVGSKKGCDVFAPKRAKASWDTGGLKATASECLSLFPVLALFFDALVGNENQEVSQHARCFLKLVSCLELVQASARRAVEPATLQQALEGYMQMFQGLFGAESMTPKFHYALHLPNLLQRYSFLPACFCLERKHRVPKKIGDEIRNTSSAWEGSVLREVTNHHVAALTDRGRQHFVAQAGLEDPKAPSKRLEQRLAETFDTPGAVFHTSRVAHVNAWERCSVGDVVMLQHGVPPLVGEIVFFASVQAPGNEVCIVAGLSLWEFVRGGARSSKWRKGGADHLCLLDEILSAVVWAAGDPIATVLTPHRR